MEFPGHFQDLFHQLNQQRLHGNTLCDCRVQVSGIMFRAHSSILAACSSHFRALLSSMETPAGQHGAVQLTLDPEVVTPEAFSTLLDMLYTSRLALRGSNVMDVLLAASHLHLTAVVRACKLYLSQRNFPTSPPRGWRSAEQQQQSGALFKEKTVVQHVDLSLDEDTPLLHEADGVEMEVSQSGGGGGVGGGLCVQEDQSSVSRKRRREENLRSVCSPTVTTGSTSSSEEEKYQLPSQSHCSVQDQTENTVVKVKVGEEEGEEVEVKQENLTSYSPDHHPLSPAGGITEHLDTFNPEEKLTADDLQTCDDQTQAADGADESMDGEALDSLSELGHVTADSLSELSFYRFLNPPTGSCDNDIMESLEAEQSLAQLTAAAVNAATESLANANEGLANASERLTHANTNESFVHLSDNADECLAQLNANEGLVHLTATTNEGLAHANAAEGLAHANANEGLVHLNANEGLVHLTANEGLADLSANANEHLADLNGNANESLADLTAATSTTNDVESAGEQKTNPEATNSLNTSSSSSVLFPVASILSSQGGCGLILSPSQSAVGAGFLAAATGASGSSRGAPAFRRIAPKATPPAVVDPDPSPSSSDGSRPVLTRASDDVLSKCKKAASEDNVLLVAGERKYACGLCCKTFLNLTDCKKHIRVHTGEKPYPCPRCGKRFSQSSHLYKHSKNSCVNWKTSI